MKFSITLLIGALTYATVIAAAPFPADLEKLERHITDISDDITNSVVHIKVEGSLNNKKFSSMGSGFVINKEGMILTNHHVVDNSFKVTAKFNGDTHEYDCKVLGSDESTDVAVLQVEQAAFKNLRPVILGKSKNAKVGQWVLAVGNPYGFDRTVSFGIISAKGRNVPQAPVLNDFIQTDAFIAPGSSGGPLLNMHGEVIGINSRGGSGLAFTIPIETALEVKDKLLKSGGSKRGWLGIQMYPMDHELRKRLKISENEGVMVSHVLKTSDFFGRLLPLDIILRVNGDVVSALESKDLQPVIRKLSDLPIGKEIRLDILRAGQKLQLSGIVKERPPSEGKKWQSPLGFVAMEITEPIADRHQFERIEGVYISHIEAGSSAQHSGLIAGDILIAAEGQQVKNAEDVKRIFSQEKAEYLLQVMRGRSQYYVIVKK